MAQLKDLIVNGATRLVGKMFANEISVTKINDVTVGNSPKFTDTTYSDATTTAHGLMTAADKTKLNGLATVATSGSYSDLSNKPTIPTIPSNNITGSGTNGYIVKFNGSNTITNGPAIGTSTTTYLRNDGTWATPPNTVTTVSTTGSGNAITALTASNGALTATKGTSFATVTLNKWS